jgi:hypothetical protein
LINDGKNIWGQLRNAVKLAGRRGHNHLILRWIEPPRICGGENPCAPGLRLVF